MAGVVGAGNKSKYILRQFPLIRFYAALTLSLAFFLLQLIVAHVTHSLILQIDSYHMLYNILSLVTCIITAKVSKQEKSLKNTFGWRRLDVCGAVANLAFLAALGFSVIVECLQTMFHVSHHETMHCAGWVGVVGIVGLAVNAIVYVLIGGFTLHQSGFMCSKEGGGEESVISATMRRGPYNHVMREREGPLEVFRDVFGCVLVIVCALIVYFWSDLHLVNFVDPGLTIFTVILLGITSYNYVIEAGQILLLTLPNHINVTSLENELKQHFPQVFDVHEFHIWQLTPAKIIASVHVVLQQPQGYLSIQDSIVSFLQDKGISHVTMQPEFLKMTESEVETPDTIRKRNKCLMPCISGEDCNERQCCIDEDADLDHHHGGHGHSHSHGGHSHSRHRSPIPSGSLGGGNFSHFESISINTSVQNPSLRSADSCRIGQGLKSESLNNHLDLSLDNVDLSVSRESAGGNSNNNQNALLNQVGEESEDLSDDDEQVQAELRPMI